MIDAYSLRVLEAMKKVGESEIEHESSEFVEEGLKITCKDGENARRMQALIRAYLPDEGWDLVEVFDKVCLLKYPEGMKAWLAKREEVAGR